MKKPRKGKKKKISEKQLAANRANAQKSTGAQTPEGREKVKFNALRHGLSGEYVLLPWEDTAEFEYHCRMTVNEMRPKSYREVKIALRIAQNDWRLDRASRFETDIITDSDNRRDMMDELLKVELYVNRIDRNTDRIEKRFNSIHLQPASEPTPEEAIYAIPIREITEAEMALDGPRFRINMPRDREEGNHWREHLNDVALANQGSYGSVDEMELTRYNPYDHPYPGQDESQPYQEVDRSYEDPGDCDDDEAEEPDFPAERPPESAGNESGNYSQAEGYSAKMGSFHTDPLHPEILLDEHGNAVGTWHFLPGTTPAEAQGFEVNPPPDPGSSA